jgi:hypothetical protein
MAKKTTSYNIIEVNGKIRKVTTNTRIVQESRLQKSRRIASENSTLFRFALSGTIVMLFFGLFLLIGTTDFYNDNQQQLNWIDENGQFIENSYNLSVTITNDTPLDDLNGLTLNDLFNDLNFVPNPDFTTTDLYWNLVFLSGGILDGLLQVNGNGLNTIFLPLYYSDVPNVIGERFFYRTRFNVVGPELKSIMLVTTTTVGGFDRQLFNFTPTNNEWYINYGAFTSDNSTGDFAIYFLSDSYSNSNQDSTTLSIDYIYVYNLSDFDLDHLSDSQINEYYEIWESNKLKRSLDNYNELGNIPVTNLENMNTVLFKPAVEIVGGMTDTANTAIGFTLQAWNFVGDIWKRIWGVE